MTFDAEEITAVGALQQMRTRAQNDSKLPVILLEDRALESCDRALAQSSRTVRCEDRANLDFVATPKRTALPRAALRSSHKWVAAAQPSGNDGGLPL